MTLASGKGMKATEFLAWRETRPDGKRHELVAGEPIEMAAERNRHNLVKTACVRALEDGVRAAGLDCTVLGDGATVVTGERDASEPDAAVQCDEPIDLDATVVPSPVILVEVLSPSTRARDAGGKLYDYFQLPSVRHYLIVDPVRLVIIHHRREGDDIATTLWREGVLALDPPGVRLAVADCFATLRRALGER